MHLCLEYFQDILTLHAFCRALSYKGAEFLIAKVKMDPEFKIMYDRSCEFWHLLSSIMRSLKNTGRKTMGQFFSSQQRFYRQMLMAAKVCFESKCLPITPLECLLTLLKLSS